jgi:hypothetical protein
LGAGVASRPTLVVAPYFCLTSATFDSWLPINIACARESEGYAQGEDVPIGVQVVLSRDVLANAGLRRRLFESYENAGISPGVFLIWIAAFSEHEATASELRAFVRLLERFGDMAPVVNLYGGFFSIALSRCGVVKSVAGVCHGPGYGEDRDVIPVGGGVPVAKFYVPALHARLELKAAFRAIRALGGLKSVDEFDNRICDCKECRELITKDPEIDFGEYMRTRTKKKEYPTAETKEHCVRHYMWCKEREYRGPLSRDQITEQLREAGRRTARVPELQGLRHTGVWREVLGEKAD